MAASPIGAIHIDQLLKTPFVNGVYSRVKAVGSVFQNFFGLTGESSGLPPVAAGQRTVFWEYFDNTRTVGTVRPHLAGPSRPVQKAAGIASGTLLRYYEALTFESNRIAGYRALGKPLGYLSSSGEDWIARQLSYLFQRRQNLVEFIVSRMLTRQGFDIVTSGASNVHQVTEYGSGQLSVDYQVPATHRTQIALGAGGADIITATWSNAATDIISHLANLRMVAERESGYTLKHGWISSPQYINMVNNTGLRNAGGSAFRVWESYVNRDMQTLQGLRERGADLVFRALPDWTFHVYDGVLNVAQDRDSLATADNTLFIPTTSCVFTPDPGDWCAMMLGNEIVKEQYGSTDKEVTGLHNWVRQVIDPVAAHEVHVLDNFLPVLTVPRAIYQATVQF